MDKDKFLDSITGLQNYDEGAIDAGIYNPALKKEISEWMHQNHDQASQWLKEYVVELFTHPEYNYTLEDVHNLIHWIAQELDYDY